MADDDNGEVFVVEISLLDHTEQRFAVMLDCSSSGPPTDEKGAILTVLSEIETTTGKAQK
jgi:hypothetical protein